MGLQGVSEALCCLSGGFSGDSRGAVLTGFSVSFRGVSQRAFKGVSEGASQASRGASAGCRRKFQMRFRWV